MLGGQSKVFRNEKEPANIQVLFNKSGENIRYAETLAFIVKTETDDKMTKEFLLHKDKKEKRKPPHIQAHLSLPDTKANASQYQKSLHFADAPS